MSRAGGPEAKSAATASTWAIRGGTSSRSARTGGPKRREAERIQTTIGDKGEEKARLPVAGQAGDAGARARLQVVVLVEGDRAPGGTGEVQGEGGVVVATKQAVVERGARGEQHEATVTDIGEKRQGATAPAEQRAHACGACAPGAWRARDHGVGSVILGRRCPSVGKARRRLLPDR